MVLCMVFIHERLDGFFKFVSRPTCRLLLQCVEVFDKVHRILEIVLGSPFL